MNLSVAKFFRRVIFSLLLLLAILTIVTSIFLSQLELDNYRYELERELSLALDQPVRIGYCKLTFDKGIALRFKDMRIGPEQAPLALLPQLIGVLKIRPLLHGQIILDRVEINNPSFQLWLPFAQRPERNTTHHLTDKLGIRILTIRDARLKIFQRHETGSQERLNFVNLDVELRGWQADQVAKLIVSGELEQADTPAKFLLDTNLPASTEPAAWRKEQLDFQFSVSNLATGLAPTLTATNRPTSVNLHATLKGVPAQDAALSIELDTNAPDQPLSRLTGRWHSSVEQEAVTELTGDFLGLPLKGEFHLLRREDRQLLAGRFGVTDFSFDRGLLERWQLPGTDNLLGGKLSSLALVAEKSWPATQPLDSLPRFGVEVSVADLHWKETNPRQLQRFSAALSLANQQLRVQTGELVADQMTITLSGGINNLFTQPQLDIKAKLQSQLRTLFTKAELPADWSLSGDLPIELSLTGPPQSPQFLLQANLGDSSLAFGKLLQKPLQQQGGLLLRGVVDAEQLQLDQLELKLPGAIITGNGVFTRDPDSEYFLLDIDPIELVSLQPFSPLLEQLQLHGSLHPILERGPDGIKSRLQLIGVGAQLNNIVGDLTQANGTIDLDREGLRFNNLKATIGSSAFLLTGQLDSWQKPQLELKLRSQSVRAQDLIFPNQQLQFYNLDGRLLIDGNGISFDPVKVQLEQDTQVVVSGSLEDFSSPQVTLDIAADKANIDQVIALFIGPPKRPNSENPRDRKPLIITARVKQGTIGNLPFENAEGLIKDHHDVFTIYPLRFQTGGGFCLARVEFDRNREGLLKISGHAEQVDATILHQNLFKERGLINGALRSDFYLEGTLHDQQFWHNASGGIHLQVEDGTLRKFRGLASVFSLLNVSQLFAGKLPDMDTEGMPFSLLEGSFHIADGSSYTEDLRIISEAMNMSLIGSQSLVEDNLDYNLGVMPLRTVDKVITSVPVAGWVLTGEDKALLTAHFKIEGPNASPKVTVVPISTVSNTIFGIFKRTLGLPGKLVKDVGSWFQSKPKKKQEPTE